MSKETRGLNFICKYTYLCLHVIIYWLSHLFSAILARILYRVKVVNHHKIPKKGKTIIVANHQSMMDIPLVTSITSRKMHFMAKKELWKHRFVSWWLDITETFPVARGSRKNKDSFDRAKKAIGDGDIIVIFPEGTRNKERVFREINAGFLLLASAYIDVQILPVTIMYHDEKRKIFSNVTIQCYDSFSLGDLNCNKKTARKIAFYRIEEIFKEVYK